MVNQQLRYLTAISLLVLSAHVNACAVFQPPRQYRNPGISIAFDAKPQALALVHHSRLAYEQAHKAAIKLDAQIALLLAEPNEETLAKARQAWRAARIQYQRTEWMRFVDGPIDWPPAPLREIGPEARLNAWPVNEAVVDYVAGSPKSGIIGQLDLPLTRKTILAKNQSNDENDVTTGWHAIEFLLWGQDTAVDGPGNRSASDFLAKGKVNERRRAYLQIASKLLIDDLALVLLEWDMDEPTSYGRRILELPASEVLGPAFHGAASLIAIELYGERFAVPLDSRSQEDEHSCFSDNTLADLRENLNGIIHMLQGSKANAAAPDSILALIEWKDPALAKQLVETMRAAKSALASVPEPFDQLILSADDSVSRAKAETALVALQLLAKKLKASAETLGLQIVVPGV